MNLEQLKMFISVVENRSFTKAAGTMYISHSTTSRNVSSLEENLGVQLLFRENRLVRLTPAGDMLYREGKKLIEKIEALQGAVKNAGLGLAGKLKVASVSLYSHKLHNGYVDFCKQYPEVMLGLFHRDISNVWPMVNGGEADVGITFSYALPDDMIDFEQRIISAEKFCVVASVSHPLAMRKSVTISDLDGYNYICLASPEYDFIKRQKGKSSVFPLSDEASVAPTIESLFLQICAGNGVSAVPYPIAYEYGSNCAILDIDEVETSFNMIMFWRGNNLNPILPRFTETMISNIS